MHSIFEIYKVEPILEPVDVRVAAVDPAAVHAAIKTIQSSIYLSLPSSTNFPDNLT
jgi:hypothetical protein